MAGVGAAFDLNSGGLAQASPWMREHGLEWLFRLMAEPRRLWRRYLIQGSQFMWNVLLEFLESSISIRLRAPHPQTAAASITWEGQAWPSGASFRYYCGPSTNNRL